MFKRLAFFVAGVFAIPYFIHRVISVISGFTQNQDEPKVEEQQTEATALVQPSLFIEEIVPKLAVPAKTFLEMQIEEHADYIDFCEGLKEMILDNCFKLEPTVVTLKSINKRLGYNSERFDELLSFLQMELGPTIQVWTDKKTLRAGFGTEFIAGQLQNPHKTQ